MLVGFPSVGKSTILNQLTNAESKIENMNSPPWKSGIMEYKTKIQIFDLPGIITGASKGKGRGKKYSQYPVIDLIVVVLDVFNLNTFQ